MAASDHLHYEQLRMFIPAKELMGFMPMDLKENWFGEGKSFYDSPWLVDRKREHFPQMVTSSNMNFAKSIEKHGVMEPVLLSKSKGRRTAVEDGHHRTIAAYDANPDMEVPVTYLWYD
jgi:hypothetical protein